MPPTRGTANKANFAARITTAGAKNCRAVPPYDGYPIRYSDERIWKPGTPGYKPEYEKKIRRQPHLVEYPGQRL